MKAWLRNLIAKFIWWRIAGWFGIPVWRPKVTPVRVPGLADSLARSREFCQDLIDERKRVILAQPLTDIPDIVFYQPKPTTDMSNGIKVPFDQVKPILDSLIYDTYHFPGTNVTVAVAKEPLRTGMDHAFVYGIGSSSCVDPDNFDRALGDKSAIKRARADAENKIWELEAYKLKTPVEEKHAMAELSRKALQGTLWPGESKSPEQGTVQPDEDFTVVRRNSDRYGAPLVGEEIELQRGGQHVREVVVYPWVHGVNDEYLDPYTRRRVPGGTTAAMRVGVEIDLAKMTNASRTKVFVGDLQALYLQVGAGYVKFPISGGSRWRPMDVPRLMSFEWEGALAIYADTDFLHTDMGRIEHYNIGSGSITMKATVTGYYDIQGTFNFAARVSDISFNPGGVDSKPDLDALRDLLAALQDQTRTSVPAADFRLTIPVALQVPKGTEVKVAEVVFENFAQRTVDVAALPGVTTTVSTIYGDIEVNVKSDDPTTRVTIVEGDLSGERVQLELADGMQVVPNVGVAAVVIEKPDGTRLLLDTTSVLASSFIGQVRGGGERFMSLNMSANVGGSDGLTHLLKLVGEWNLQNNQWYIYSLEGSARIIQAYFYVVTVAAKAGTQREVVTIQLDADDPNPQQTIDKAIEHYQGTNVQVQALPAGLVAIPKYTDDRAKFLLDDAVTTVDVGTASYDTAPYRFGPKMNVMGLTQATPGADATDVISSTATGLQSVYVKHGDGAIEKIDLASWDQHLLLPEQPPGARIIMFNREVFFRLRSGPGFSARVVIVIDTETGDLQGNVTMLDAEVGGLELVAFDLHLERVNYNRLPR